MLQRPAALQRRGDTDSAKGVATGGILPTFAMLDLKRGKNTGALMDEETQMLDSIELKLTRAARPRVSKPRFTASHESTPWSP